MSETALPRVVINADDFGLSASVNEAIVRSFEQRLISSTTIMANMPAFEEACEIARSRGLVGKIGLHINLVDGPPLTSAIQKFARFCGPSGNFLGTAPNGGLLLSSDESDALATEIREQLRRCLKQGIHPTHMDSHHHSHTALGIGSIVAKIAKEQGISAIRLNGNCRPNLSFERRLFVAIYNTRLRLLGLAKTSRFGTPQNVSPYLAPGNGVYEVLVHPDLDEKGNLIDAEYKIALNEFVATLGRFELVPYPS
jgi:hypothetical protein